MFLGPFEQGGDYRDQGISGPHSFLARVWQSVLDAQEGAPDPLVERKLHQTIRQGTEQIAGLHYNTAIDAPMEELYHRLGHNDGLFGSARWPVFDDAKAAVDTVEVAVQVNGKLRARLVIGVGAPENTVRARALELENVARHVDSKTIRKVIFVPDKLLNLV